ITLFFLSYSDHRDLHSFPTRRSSDLRGTEARRPRYRARGLQARAPAFILIPLSPSRSPRGGGSRTTISGGAECAHCFARHSSSRSEEHTSELQSRGHLVCRLLLEKKK